MTPLHLARHLLTLGGLLVLLCLTACRKSPPPEAPPAAPSAVGVATEPAGTPPPQTTAAPVESLPAPDFDKMTTEEKYWTEMSDSITSFIQDHLRAGGRMPRDAKDVMDLKIMTRVDVPPNYELVIDQKTGKASFKKKKK